MFAVIKTGGKQYRVAKGDKIRVEKLEAEEGSKLDCEVLYAEGGQKATVSATVIGHDRDKKIIVFKRKRRQGYRRTAGHKQHKTVIEITDVKAA